MTIHRRAYRALTAVLPPSADVQLKGDRVLVNGRSLRMDWLTQGWLSDARAAVRATPRPDIVVAKHLSSGARDTLGAAGIGWIDEAGGAEINLGTIIVTKSGRPAAARDRRRSQWTPTVLAVTEAVLCGTRPVVAAVHEATGVAVGSCAHALRFLSTQGFLTARAERGRQSARALRDVGDLLRAYAEAANASDRAMTVEVGVVWRDAIAGLKQVGDAWSSAGREWAVTGTAAAALLAPHLTADGRTDVYVAADTIAELEAAAREAGLRPLEGGRLHLRPFPTRTCRTLRSDVQGLSVAPWPRVYADVRMLGVRGEESAEHLFEVMRGG